MITHTQTENKAKVVIIAITYLQVTGLPRHNVILKYIDTKFAH